jgi:hypothetical protein
MHRSLRIGFAFLAVYLLASNLLAYPTVNFWGCYECYLRQNITLADEQCQFVKDKGEGWSKCYEMTIGIETFCNLGGDACYNETVIGGGSGGSGGGSGGGTCTVRYGSLCPAACESCEYVFFF